MSGKTTHDRDTSLKKLDRYDPPERAKTFGSGVSKTQERILADSAVIKLIDDNLVPPDITISGDGALVRVFYHGVPMVSTLKGADTYYVRFRYKREDGSLGWRNMSPYPTNSLIAQVQPSESSAVSDRKVSASSTSTTTTTTTTAQPAPIVKPNWSAIASQPQSDWTGKALGDVYDSRVVVTSASEKEEKPPHVAQYPEYMRTAATMQPYWRVVNATGKVPKFVAATPTNLSIWSPDSGTAKSAITDLKSGGNNLFVAVQSFLTAIRTLVTPVDALTIKNAVASNAFAAHKLMVAVAYETLFELRYATTISNQVLYWHTSSSEAAKNLATELVPLLGAATKDFVILYRETALNFWRGAVRSVDEGTLDDKTEVSLSLGGAAGPEGVDIKNIHASLACLEHNQVVFRASFRTILQRLCLTKRDADGNLVKVMPAMNTFSPSTGEKKLQASVNLGIKLACDAWEKLSKSSVASHVETVIAFHGRVARMVHYFNEASRKRLKSHYSKDRTGEELDAVYGSGPNVQKILEFLGVNAVEAVTPEFVVTFLDNNPCDLPDSDARGAFRRRFHEIEPVVSVKKEIPAKKGKGNTGDAHTVKSGSTSESQEKANASSGKAASTKKMADAAVVDSKVNQKAKEKSKPSRVGKNRDKKPGLFDAAAARLIDREATTMFFRSSEMEETMNDS